MLNEGKTVIKDKFIPIGAKKEIERGLKFIDFYREKPAEIIFKNCILEYRRIKNIQVWSDE